MTAAGALSVWEREGKQSERRATLLVTAAGAPCVCASEEQGRQFIPQRGGNQNERRTSDGRMFNDVIAMTGGKAGGQDINTTAAVVGWRCLGLIIVVCER